MINASKMESMVVLAVTKMHTGMCIAGLNQRGEWLRPVRDFGHLSLRDVSYPNGSLMRCFDIAQLPILKRRASGPHVEDAIADFNHYQPRLAGTISPAERGAWLRSHAEHAATAAKQIYQQNERSLALVKVQELSATMKIDSYSGKLEMKVWAEELGQMRPIPCTDVHWRALGRKLLPEGGLKNMEWPELSALLGCTEVYLTLGLARQFEGEYWPLVVGVHTVPGYDVDIDTRNL